MPSSADFMDKVDKTEDQVAMPSQSRNADTMSATSKRSVAEENDVSEREQEPRFGFSSIGTTGTVCAPFPKLFQK